jgi:hypothetical protein
MEIQDTSAAIYSEAKSEYTKQLVFNFQPTLLRFFLDRHAEAKASQAVTSKTKSVLSEFQESLTQIPEWNLDKVQRETASLLQTVHCDYIEDLITAVFIAHTKILSAIRLNAKPRQKIRITVPKPDHFMHRTLSECSRLLWSNVYLFSDMGSSLDRQKNMNDVNRLLEEGLLQAIRNLLPVKSILRDSLQEEEDDIQIHNEPEQGFVKATEDSPTGPVEEGATGAQGLDTSLDEIPVSEKPMALAEPLALAEPMALAEPIALADSAALAEPVTSAEPVAAPMATPMAAPMEPLQTETNPDVKGLHLTSDAFPKKTVSIEKQNTFVVDTERSVGFTGVDSVFGTAGDAELRPMIDEGSEEFKILGELEALDTDEFEDLDSVTPSIPLGSDDYESI